MYLEGGNRGGEKEREYNTKLSLAFVVWLRTEVWIIQYKLEDTGYYEKIGEFPPVSGKGNHLVGIPALPSNQEKQI